MIFRSNRKIGKGKKAIINILYKLGIKPTNIGNFIGVSRASVYRHIDR